MRNLMLIFVIIFYACVFNTNAQTRRALMIGIDQYLPGDNELNAMQNRGVSFKRMTNLDGCTNDITAVDEILKSRFGFTDQNIRKLSNQEATRENIIAAFEKLIGESQKGDVVVIYYAGHGSQVRNTLSDEADQKDETMVPADAYKFAKHIRDKELAKIFYRLAEKGVILTIIYDSCHSGSIGRGVLTNEPPKTRFTDPDTTDAKDPSLSPDFISKGALLISAAQDDEVASEQRDEQGTPHGAFTYAFLQAMQTVPVTASAADIFSSIRAIMKYYGKRQEPVIEGSPERKKSTLLGIDKKTLSGKTMVAVMKKENDTEVELQGGYAVGLNINSVLYRLTESKDSIILKVTKMKGINKCSASVQKGKIENIKPGDMFELNSFSSTGGPSLKIYVPKTEFTYDDILKISTQLAPLKNNKNITWITDPTTNVPTHTVFYSGKEWFMGTPDGKTLSLGKQPDIGKITSNAASGAKLFVNLPPYGQLRDELHKAYTVNNVVQTSDTATDCQYYLAGRAINDRVEYAYILPSMSEQDAATNPLPVRTDFIGLNPKDKGFSASIDTLEEYSLKLAKLKAWLTLNGPADDGSFPFYLALKNKTTKQLVTSGEVYDGESYSLALVTDKENKDYWDGAKRYIYVMALDCKGATQVLYPAGGSVENKFPRKDSNTGEVMDEVNLPGTYTIGEPFGVDTYILLTTDEPLPNPEVLNQSGVKSRGLGSNGLTSLISNVGASTRGAISSTPANWSIKKFSVRSKAKK